MKGQQGFGLAELMVTSLLASLIIMMLMQHYLNAKRPYLYAQVLLEQAFELQLVNDLIRDSVRRAGFTPCVSINHLQTVDRRHERAKLIAIQTEFGKHHALHINRMSEYFTQVLQIISPTRLLVVPEQPYKTRQAILIADCYHAEVQQILSVQRMSQGVIVILPQPLAFDYVEPIYVGEWIEEAFFIQKNKEGKSALFYQINHAEELTALINKLTAYLTFHQGKILLAIELGLDNGQSLAIETAMRVS